MNLYAMERERAKMDELITQFIEVLLAMPADAMEGWRSNPDAFQTTLKRALYPPRTGLLEFVSMVVISASVGAFVARDKFVVNTGPDAPVRISHISDNFTEWFLSGDGKVEDLIAGTTLRYYRLRKLSVDTPIIEELGGEEKSKTALTEIFSLMAGQKNGDNGALLNNGGVNIFYVRDRSGRLRVVSVRWRGGWRVGAYSVEHPVRWDGGRQVFSRDSVLEPSATGQVLSLIL